MSDILFKDLNNEQIECLKQTEGVIRVMAGAGTGKTRALTYRFAYLLTSLGIAPRAILALTFTNRAAGEMKERIASLCGNNIACNIMTFHGYCAHFLKLYGSRVNFESNFAIIDRNDSKEILDNIYSYLSVNGRDITQRQMLDFIALQKSGLDYISYLKDKSALEIRQMADGLDDLKLKIYYYYLSAQRQSISLDFDDLINFTVFILKSDAALASDISRALEYIMVDEFQDVDGSQYELLKILCHYHNNLFVVGDPDQSIYAFRGSDPKIMLTMQTDFASLQTLYLLNNYRTQSLILDAAYALITHNASDLRKKLKSCRKKTDIKELVTTHDSFIKALNHDTDDDRQVLDTLLLNAIAKDELKAADKGDIKDKKTILACVKNDRQEALYISHVIKSILKEQGDVSIGVLCRAHMQIRELERAFIENKIAYKVSSTVRYTDRKEIRDIIAYLRLMLNGNDDTAFVRVINSPRRGFGKSRMQRLSELSQKHNMSLFNTLRALAQMQLECTADDNRLITKAVGAFILASYKCSDLLSLSPIQALDTLLSVFDYEKKLRDSGDVDRLESLSVLRQMAIAFAKGAQERVNIADFLSSLMLSSDKTVQCSTELMTVHNAKGLEFDYVFIAGVNEGLFPSRKALSTEQVQEERRLFYVAMTRARRQLFLVQPGGFFANSEKRRASRFIGDIGQDLLLKIGLDTSIDDNMQKPASSQGCVFEPGDKVFSDVLGAGVIENINDKDCEYVIFFERLGRSRTLSFMAPLKKLEEP